MNKESREYKVKKAIQDFCNNENNWIVAVRVHDLLGCLKEEFDVPSFTQDIMAVQKFEEEVFSALGESLIKVSYGELRQSIDDEGGESRCHLMILQTPKGRTKNEN